MSRRRCVLAMSTFDNFLEISPDRYREICSQFATGVAVAAVRASDGTPHGLTVSSFTAVSIHPPLILICMDFACRALPHFRSETHFAINVLTNEQRELSVAFAAKPEGRFEGVDWAPGETGAPVLAGCLATIECARERVIDAGDHAVVFGKIVRGDVHSGDPLIYYNRAYRTLR